MSEQLVTSVVTVLTAIIGVALIAVLVSRNANTSGVLSSGGTAASNLLSTAISPISGSSLFGLSGGGGLPNLTL